MILTGGSQKQKSNMIGFDLNMHTENPLNLKHNIVYIEGNLIVDTDRLPIIGLQSMCYADDSYKQYANCIIENDLLINDDNVMEYSSFTTFIAKFDIVYYKGGGADLPFPIGEIKVYEERWNEFCQLLESVNDDSPQLLLQSLYASVFSRYEYAVMLEVLYFLKYRQNEIISFFKKKRSTKLGSIADSDIPDGEKELEIMSYIRENIYAGNAQFIKDLFQAILDESIEIPDSLQGGYKKRNSIVHRAGCDTYGYPIVFTKEDIKSISNDIDGFTSYLRHKCRSTEMKWVDSVRSELGLPPL